MKRLFSFVCTIVAIVQTVNAQTINVQGTIKNEKGIALPFVFVQEKQSKSAIYTDSLGNFNISVNSPSTLQFSLNGYGDTSIGVNKNTSLQVVLRYNGSSKNKVTGDPRRLNSDVSISDAF
jgi:iron complex outermembrane receptor protein